MTGLTEEEQEELHVVLIGIQSELRDYTNKEYPCEGVRFPFPPPKE